MLTPPAGDKRQDDLAIHRNGGNHAAGWHTRHRDSPSMQALRTQRCEMRIHLTVLRPGTTVERWELHAGLRQIIVHALHVTRLGKRTEGVGEAG